MTRTFSSSFSYVQIKRAVREVLFSVDSVLSKLLNKKISPVSWFNKLTFWSLAEDSTTYVSANVVSKAKDAVRSSC